MNYLRHASVVAAAGFCAAMAQASFGALLNINGSFEDDVLVSGDNANPSVSGAPTQLDSGVDPTTINGWVVENNGTDDIRHYRGEFFVGNFAQDGQQYVGFTSYSAGEGGTISRSFATTIGDTYTVSFYANNAFVGGIHQLIASVDTTIPTQETVTPIAASTWEFFDFDFIATDTTSTLSFTSLILGNSDNGDILLDNVVVIPEPSSLALLGLGGLLIARRRR